MMILDELPEIEGGSVKQQMFAESVRLNFISFVEENLPQLQDSAMNLVRLHTKYKWWIDRAYKINPKSVKLMISAADRFVAKHGSLEDARKAIAEADSKSYEYLKSIKILGGILD
jgi:hypothetical protein